MRQLLCESCAADKREGSRRVYERGSFGEPAEYERVIWGFAATPKWEQRIMKINGEPHPLSLDGYDCDLCGERIAPGARCAAWSVWAEGQSIPSWEDEFLC